MDQRGVRRSDKPTQVDLEVDPRALGRAGRECRRPGRQLGSRTATGVLRRRTRLGRAKSLLVANHQARRPADDGG
jgi:hypothetical protein